MKGFAAKDDWRRESERLHMLTVLVNGYDGKVEGVSVGIEQQEEGMVAREMVAV